MKSTVNFEKKDLCSAQIPKISRYSSVRKCSELFCVYFFVQCKDYVEETSLLDQYLTIDHNIEMYSMRSIFPFNFAAMYL